MQRFNHYNSTVIVPLLARIVLFVAFFFIGANKLFQQMEFDANQAERLRELGATVVPIEHDNSAAAWPGLPGRHGVATPVALVVSDDAEPEHANDEADEVGDEENDEPTEDVAPELDPAEEVDPDPEQVDDVDEVEEPVDQRRYMAAVRHSVTLRVDEAGWPFPIWQARLVASVEMVGGALLLIGLFSRLWGLLLAGTMIGAFYLVSMGDVGVHQANPFNTFMDTGVFNMVAAQLALFVLAFSILLTGPGPISVDQIIFRSRHDKHDLAGGNSGSYRPARRPLSPEGRNNLE